jgi:hypothetical protein
MTNRVLAVIAGIVFSLMACSLVVAFVLYANSNKKHNEQLKRNQMLENTISSLQQEDIQELLSHVRKVMAGDIVYEWDDATGKYSPLVIYSFTSGRRQSFPTTHTIESDLTVLEINLDGNSGEMIIAYFIRYLDESGSLIHYRGDNHLAPSRWMLERHDGKWFITQILSYKEWLG